MNKINYRKSLIDKMEGLVEAKEITIQSVKTAYLSAGSGYPVIFLHGAGAVTWYPTIGIISEKFQVIVPDIIGYGESDKPNASYDRPFFSSWLKGSKRIENIKSSYSWLVARWRYCFTIYYR